MKKFDIPEFFKSSIISAIKEIRKTQDPRKNDFTPTNLDFGPIRFLIARHFGFCFGVENAIEISYRALRENPGKRIFLLSQMIHNPDVNNDLQDRGIEFIMDTEGNQFVDWKDLTADDIVIIPAFGTTLETEKKLNELGIETLQYNTTCPFVERVWNRTQKLGEQGFSIIIHGKQKHEETRATFSHSNNNAPSVIIKDLEEAKTIASLINGQIDRNEFFDIFQGRHSEGFDPSIHFNRIGVVNQTTMLATETKAISNCLKTAIIEKYGEDNTKEHFADTRDTLCYATNDNQEATYKVLESKADIAIVVGGYNSSNTSHIVELCERKLPTYYVSGPEEILSNGCIRHFDYQKGSSDVTKGFLPNKKKVTIILTSGASCPDSTVEAVLQKLLSFYKKSRAVKEVLLDLGKGLKVL
jgi:4-hydroxy-3-methylbut-2-enyl diphosphate reductase